MLQLVGILLSDNSPGVIGAAATAFNSICPYNLSLIKRNFQRLCETLPDVEEWAQIILIEILLRYVVARHGLVKDSIMFASASTLNSQSDPENAAFSTVGGEQNDFKLNRLMLRCYVEGQEEYLSPFQHIKEDGNDPDDLYLTTSMNDDVRILLRCTSPLMWSQNSAVVLAAAGVHWIMAPKNEVERIVRPILFILRSSCAAKHVVIS